jgi:hypothetical protein
MLRMHLKNHLLLCWICRAFEEGQEVPLTARLLKNTGDVENDEESGCFVSVKS